MIYESKYMGLTTNLKLNSNIILHMLLFSKKFVKKILKIFLLWIFYQTFNEMFAEAICDRKQHELMEYYVMDNKIIQLLLQNILAKKDYDMEGISYYTRIPYDVIYDAASGIRNQFSMTTAFKIVDLFIKDNPEIAKIIIQKLSELLTKNPSDLSFFLN